MNKFQKPQEIREIVTDSWINITDTEYKQLTTLVYNSIGINLTDEKRTLLMGRLQKILRKYRLSNFQDYYQFIISDSTGNALSELANCISTNHTYFFRENDHFDFFIKRTLPEIDQRLEMERSKDIRIWSAGCSSGEEPYTLVMLMKEYFGPRYPSFSAGILATDISEKALDIAKAGIYPDTKIKEMPDRFKKKYMKSLAGGDVQINDDVKKEVLFRRFNLMNKDFPFKKQFHTIFCRNVMIYFDEPTRETLVNKFYDLLVPGGYLFIGHSETLKREKHKYQYIMPALYLKPYE